MDTCRHEYYMLKHPVWAQANPALDGMLCIGCAEKRLGRRLRASDFTEAPVNYDPRYCPSARLIHRRDRYRRRARASFMEMWYDQATLDDSSPTAPAGQRTHPV
jgi:hypothetical protein